jgi:hypothetical protein
MSLTNDFDSRVSSSRQVMVPERVRQIGLENYTELIANSYT